MQQLEQVEQMEQLEQTLTGGAQGAARGVTLVGYAPITRVDAERREIELCATSEALDAHGTIFDYAASKDAFTRWLGNVREMHERRAVGRRVAVRCDDATRRVYVRLRISRGAQDTWEKVLDGTLRGASIGANDVVWRRERRTLAGRGRMVNVATRYDLAELSLVDNPSNPDALGVTFVRDATPDVTLLDPLESPELPEQPESMEAADEQAPAVGGADGPAAASTEAPRAGRLPLHEASRALLAGCGCPRCDVALATLADDPLDDTAPMAAESNEPGEPGMLATARQAEATLTRALAAGLRVNAARLARLEATLAEAVAALRTAQAEGASQAMRAGDEERRALAERAESQAAQAARIVEELRARVTRLEAQPAPGGPAARPVEKTLAALGGAGAGAGIGGADELAAGAEAPALRALEALAGRLRDPQAQLAVAAEMIRLQQQGQGG